MMILAGTFPRFMGNGRVNVCGAPGGQVGCIISNVRRPWSGCRESTIRKHLCNTSTRIYWALEPDKRYTWKCSTTSGRQSSLLCGILLNLDHIRDSSSSPVLLPETCHGRHSVVQSKIIVETERSCSFRVNTAPNFLPFYVGRDKTKTLSRLE